METIWKSRDQKPEKRTRILVFSPSYPKEHEMRIRIIDSEFLKITTEVQKWTELENLIHL